MFAGDKVTERKSKGDILKFFLSDIPEGCTPWDLATALRSYEEIVGVYIARKRRKEGLIFGFLSFRCARNKEELISSLKNIRIGNNKLKINVARFAMENGHLDPSRLPAENNQNYVGATSNILSEVNIPGDGGFGGKRGRSYVDIVTNRSGGLESDFVIKIESNNCAMSGVHGKAIMGRTVDFKTLRSLNLLLWGSGYLGAEIRLLDKKFKVWVSEELSDWIPNFLVKESMCKETESQVGVGHPMDMNYDSGGDGAQGDGGGRMTGEEGGLRS
ncbi:putative RNA recognition motif domain, nucleotide-binding alpha-beta plait domain superfamily [Helianthus anomalus]